ncbi:hypothetical protein BJ944DRAFT_270950 [Cunninghamella echinulata]|nr:hypothetical protein BJ944DRAFT_270950 [Cunninghamella echinulata]
MSYSREPEDYDPEEINNHNTNDGYYYDDEDDYTDYSYDAEAEWEETKQQVNTLFSLVIFPFVGKWLGRKCSFWIWSRWTNSPRTITSSNFLSIQWINSLKRISQ